MRLLRTGDWDLGSYCRKEAMTQELQDVSLSTARAMKAEAEQKGLYFNTAVLARFLRANYGDDAVKEAQRHVLLYERIKDAELAGIWRRVLAHVTGVELVEDQRRIVKAAKP
jgi:hypothetical protein